MITIDKINITVSTKTNKDKLIVKKINELYWKEVKSKLTNLEETTVSVKGLVNFTISRYLLYNKIYDTIASIRFTSWSRRLTDGKKKVIIEQHYEYLRRLLKQRNEIAKLYYEHHKRIFETNSQRMEQSGQDSRGSSEYSENELRLPA